MSRFLAFQSVGKLGSSILTEGRSSKSDVNKYERFVKLGFNLPQCRSYCHFTYLRGGHFAETIHHIKYISYRSNFSRKFSVISASSAATHDAKVAWQRLYRKYASRGRTHFSVCKIAQAVSMALTHKSLLVPGIFAFSCGQLAWSQRILAETDHYSKQNPLFMYAQDGQALVSSLLFSVGEGIVLLLRALYLLVLFSPSIVMAPLVEYFGPQYRRMWLQLVHWTLKRAGPAFIKWGQWAATRPDLFPGDLCTKLAELHSKAPEHKFAYTKKTIERAFGRKISDIFDDFEEAPVASGSIAQVHRASLKFRYPGKQVKPTSVAVKVRHPGVGESIRRDFVIINVVAKVSKFIPALEWLRLDESVHQFGVFMMSQVDLSREASQLSRFIYNFRRSNDISFPKPVYPLVHPAVLVESYEQGECVSNFLDGLEGHDKVKAKVAHIGTHALLKMLLVDNFIHADMHPGNILVRVAQSKSSMPWLFKSKPHVIFLDVGMTAELSKSDQVNLLEFFKAVARRDGRTAAECTLRLSKEQNCANPNAFIEEMEESFNFWGTPEGDIVHPAECMHELLEKVRRHKVNVDGSVCTALVTTLVLEGWQRKLDPGYNIMGTLQNMLLKADWATSLSYTIDALMAP